MAISVEKRAIILVLCALVPTSIIGYIAYQQTAKIASVNTMLIRQNQVREELDELLAAIRDAESSVRGYIITGKEEFLPLYFSSVPQVNKCESRLSNSLANEPEQRARLDSLEPLIAERMDRLATLIMLRQKEGFDAAKGMVSIGKGRQLMEQIRTTASQMEETEMVLDKEKEKHKTDAKSMFRVSIILTLFALALVGCNLFFIRLR